MDILTNPLIVAVLAILAVPAVTSALAGILKSLQTSTGIPSEVFVYVASLILTGVVILTGGVQLPSWAGDPVTFVGAWLAWLVANAELARRVYEALHERVTTVP